MRKKLSKGASQAIFWAVFLSMLGLIYLWADFHNKKRVRHILESPAYSTGRFVEFDQKRKMYTGTYLFNVEEEVFYGERGNGRFRNFDSSIFGKYFPVIYNKREPAMCDILVFPDDFEKYGMAFPDSLKWVEAFE